MGPQPSRMSEKTVLFIIDPQVDFLPTGCLPIPGSDEDSERIAEMIKEHVDEIDEIYVSISFLLIDIHHRPSLDSILSHLIPTNESSICWIR